MWRVFESEGILNNSEAVCTTKTSENFAQHMVPCMIKNQKLLQNKMLIIKITKFQNPKP